MSDAAEERARLERLVAERRGTLGEEHLATLSAILDLADRLWAEGRLIAAGKLEKQVVAGRRRILGEQHLDSLVAMGNLAAVLWQQGDRDEAYALQQHVVGLQRRVRGDGDRATRAAAEVLEMMERDSGF